MAPITQTKKLTKTQLHVITSLLDNDNRYVHGSPLYNAIHITDGKHEGFRLYFSRNTLNSLVRIKYLLQEKDYKYILNRDLVN